MGRWPTTGERRIRVVGRGEGGGKAESVGGNGGDGGGGELLINKNSGKFLTQNIMRSGRGSRPVKKYTRKGGGWWGRTTIGAGKWMVEGGLEGR